MTRNTHFLAILIRKRFLFRPESVNRVYGLRMASRPSGPPKWLLSGPDC